MTLRRPGSLLLALALVLSLGLAGCGNKESVVTEGETEGAYLDIGELKYQVQMSRQLNPLSADDRSYLAGLAPPASELGRSEECDEEFFAVFMRVQNETDEAHVSALDFEIRDTEENVYTPVEFPPVANPFVYRSVEVPPGKVVPLEDSPTAERPPSGGLILFKLCRFSIDNRPLELIIRPRDGGEVGVLNLDV